MRSELVFGAMAYVSNRFLLTMLASKATGKLHRPNTRTQDTTNDVFVRFRRANPVAGVPRTGNLQPFPCAAQAETHSLFEHLRQPLARARAGVIVLLPPHVVYPKQSADWTD